MTLSPYSTHQSYSLLLNNIRQRSRTSFSQVSNDPSHLSIVLFAASEAETEEKKKICKNQFPPTTTLSKQQYNNTPLTLITYYLCKFVKTRWSRRKLNKVAS
ncbi:hypothetical protein T10_1888 [Trichinella papuae]|uniref:Uncharacterized protein n=1 Tax=Trichinella papuae TaxID=268474 RepID=A0A0V1MS82_9BILA|nr:hypothetical protein T10_1888 [Trichinella papuae]